MRSNGLKRLTMVISHPIQYHAPLYTHIAKDGRIALHVIFHNDRGARPYYEPYAGQLVAYDNDLLQGYSHEFLTKGEPSGVRARLEHRLLPGLEERILQSRPDAVCFHGYNSLPHLRAFRYLKRRGVRLYLRGENEDVIPRPRSRAFAREMLLRRLFHWMDGVLVIGRANREFFERRGWPGSKMFFVPYSADNAFFGIGINPDDHKALRTRVLARYDLDPAAVVFVNINKHRDVKRPMDLLRAYAEVEAENNQGAPSALLLVGDGPLNAQMREFVASRALKNVRFTGFLKQSEMRDVLLASDYCINPAEEPWGCVYNEALPAGLGIISSDRVCGWYDLVRVGVNGFVYRCGDVDALALTLKECAVHPEWRPAYAEASRAIARQYSFETCVEGLLQALV